MKKIQTGSFVVPTAACEAYYQVTEDYDDLKVPAGRVVIQADFTGLRFFARVDGERRWLAAWNCYVYSVVIENIDTTVEEGAIWGTLGKRRPGRRWLVRADNIARCSSWTCQECGA